MRRPTILIMNRVYPPVRGATGRLLQDVAQAFVREGWNVTVVSSGPNAGESREGGVRIIRVKGAEKPSGLLAYMWIWIKMLVVSLRVERRHVVLTMSDPPMLVFLGAFMARVKKSKHVNWCHDVYPEVLPALGMHPPAFLMRFFKYLRRRAMRACDHVIVCGRCMREYLVDDGLEFGKVCVVPNWSEVKLVDGVDLSQEESCADDVRAFENQVKTKQRFRVLYAGNIGLAHPVDVILDAAEGLQAGHHDIEFVFVGDGPRFDYIAQERARRGLDNIRFLPYQPAARLHEVLESGDMHLITLQGEAEGFIVPSKLYAAMAVARPCIFIGPQECEAARVIREFKAGVVIPQGDAAHLMASVILFRKNGDAWFEAHKGAMRAREVFTREGSIDKLVGIVWDTIKDEIEG